MQDAAPFPFPFATASLSGRKHYNSGCPINEDITGTFTFSVNALTATGHEDAAGFFLADGHGETSILPLTSLHKKSWEGSPGEKFVKVLTTVLPKTVETVFKDAFERWELEKSSAGGRGGGSSDVWNFPSEETLVVPKDEDVSSVARLHRLITMKLGELRQRLDKKLVDVDEELCKNNGSTIVLGLVAYSWVWFCNVGDSSMMLFDKQTGTPLHIWQRPDIEIDAQPCSYEDTLACYPKWCREGQTLKAVEVDHKKLSGRGLRKREDANKFPHWSLVSPKSPYALNMINSLGNANHKDLMINRTAVYSFSLSELVEKVTGNSVIAVFVSDGVKDTLTTTEIGTSLLSLEAFLRKYSKSPSETDIQTLLTSARLHPTPDKSDTKAADFLLEIIMSLDGEPMDLESFCDGVVNLSVLRGSADDVSCLAVELSLSTDGVGEEGGKRKIETPRSRRSREGTPGVGDGRGVENGLMPAIVYSRESPILTLQRALEAEESDDQRVQVGTREDASGDVVMDDVAQPVAELGGFKSAGGRSIGKVSELQMERAKTWLEGSSADVNEPHSTKATEPEPTETTPKPLPRFSSANGDPFPEISSTHLAKAKDLLETDGNEIISIVRSDQAVLPPQSPALASPEPRRVSFPMMRQGSSAVGFGFGLSPASSRRGLLGVEGGSGFGFGETAGSGDVRMEEAEEKGKKEADVVQTSGPELTEADKEGEQNGVVSSQEKPEESPVVAVSVNSNDDLAHPKAESDNANDEAHQSSQSQQDSQSSQQPSSPSSSSQHPTSQSSTLSTETETTPRASHHNQTQQWTAFTPKYDLPPSQQTFLETPARNLLNELQDAAGESSHHPSDDEDADLEHAKLSLTPTPEGSVKGDGGPDGGESTTDGYDSDATMPFEDANETQGGGAGTFVSLQSVDLGSGGTATQQVQEGEEERDGRHLTMGSWAGSVDLSGETPSQKSTKREEEEDFVGDVVREETLEASQSLSQQSSHQSQHSQNSDPDNDFIESSQPPISSAFFRSSFGASMERSRSFGNSPTFSQHHNDNEEDSEAANGYGQMGVSSFGFSFVGSLEGSLSQQHQQSPALGKRARTFDGEDDHDAEEGVEWGAQSPKKVKIDGAADLEEGEDGRESGVSPLGKRSGRDEDDDQEEEGVDSQVDEERHEKVVAVPRSPAKKVRTDEGEGDVRGIPEG
ncbi:hypothetical protein HK097_009047 [Rhizophlyctis rosea]|uniref:PPM-type phosphatase domain-containing protein n=1 Tax=Rhizophlyctis rosea TaxID=64517 RepID=A0AAD5X5C0_9FUNG|nr:hypothetical protein HK097_009047 [Rhizophlyctis rosea]